MALQLELLPLRYLAMVSELFFKASIVAFALCLPAYPQERPLEMWAEWDRWSNRWLPGTLLLDCGLRSFKVTKGTLQRMRLYRESGGAWQEVENPTFSDFFIEFSIPSHEPYLPPRDTAGIILEAFGNMAEQNIDPVGSQMLADLRNFDGVDLVDALRSEDTRANLEQVMSMQSEATRIAFDRWVDAWRMLEENIVFHRLEVDSTFILNFKKANLHERIAEGSFAEVRVSLDGIREIGLRPSWITKMERVKIPPGAAGRGSRCNVVGN